MDHKILDQLIGEIKSIDANIDHLSSAKKNIESDMSSLRSRKEEIRLSIENYMKSDSKSYISMRDGTEVSIRNSPKTFSWADDNQMIEFLKSIGKFDSVCTVETVINKKKLKSLLDQLNDCDGMPPFVECSQEKVLQIKSPSVEKEVKSSVKANPIVKNSNIAELDESQLDGI